MGKLTYTTAKVQELLDKVNEVFHKGPTYNSAGASYTIFARIEKNTIGTISLASFLVAGGGSQIIKKRGLHYLEVLNRSTGFNLVSTELVAQASGTVTYGYYEDGNYYYIGVYRTGGYGGPPVSFLMTSGSNRPIEFGNYGNSSTQPAGWTAAET